jgi:SAM-dependent methyltransferase
MSSPTSSEFDHYMDASQAIKYLPSVSRDAEILIPGCGTSRLGAALYGAGFPNVTNIDVSEDVVNAMTRKHALLKDMQYAAIDACDTRIPASGSFNVVFDKAFLDCLLADKHGLEKAQKYLREMHRLLVQGGHMLVISHGLPEKRLSLLSNAFGVHPSTIRVSTSPKPANVPGIESFGASRDFFVYEIRKL